MPTRKKTAAKKTAARKDPKPSPKASKPSQLDRIEKIVNDQGEFLVQTRIAIMSKMDLLLSGATFMQELDKAKEEPKPLGLQPGDYTDASKETADALTAMGWGWLNAYQGYDYIRLSTCTVGELTNSSARHFKPNHLTPAEFLSRAAVTAKELGLVPVEPWVPKENEWVVVKPIIERVDAIGYGRDFGDGPIKALQVDTMRRKHPIVALEKNEKVSGAYIWCDARNLRPATDAEVQQHLADQEAKKPVEFGTRVNHTTRGQGLWMGMDGILHELAFLKHGKDQQHQWTTILCPRSMFTVIDPQP